MIWNKSPVSIEFHFDTIRQFETIKIFTMNSKYQSIDIKFDDNPLIKHYISPKEISSSKLYLDTIQLNKYGHRFQAKTIEMIFEFQQDLILTEITFDNEIVSLMNTTVNLNNTIICSNSNFKRKNSLRAIFCLVKYPQQQQQQHQYHHH